MPSGPAGDREREILTAIVETFIATGEPVGSRTLARTSREGLSAATIRNVMADLADAGFLDQPHTSAGRIPSTEAYRYYVEQLSGETRLSHENESIIQDTLTGVTDVQEFMERTSHVLSLISRSVGVTVASSGPRNALEHVYFSRLGDQKVLAVLVTVCCAWICRRRNSTWPRATSTKISVAGSWKTCGSRSRDAWKKSAASMTG
jgi:heat-inducible transcriptional repressor